MKYKANVKRKASSLNMILLSALMGIAIQIIGAAIVALMTGQGSVQEGSMLWTSGIIRIIGVITTALSAWWLSPEKKISDISIAAGIVMILPLIISMLFWDVDVRATAIGIAVSLGVFAGCIWLLKRPVKGRQWRPGKKHYR